MKRNNAFTFSRNMSCQLRVILMIVAARSNDIEKILKTQQPWMIHFSVS